MILRGMMHPLLSRLGGLIVGRALDESLHIESTERNFLIMTRYCAKAVFLDRVSNEGGWGKLSAWWTYFRTLFNVRVYEYYLDFRALRDRFRRKSLVAFFSGRYFWHAAAKVE
jgi:hypothetical protein